MGLCKCKKKTNWYCFDHKKYCHVDTYSSWLDDASPKPALCTLCSQTLREVENRYHVSCLVRHLQLNPPILEQRCVGCPPDQQLTFIVPREPCFEALSCDILEKLSHHFEGDIAKQLPPSRNPTSLKEPSIQSRDVKIDMSGEIDSSSSEVKDEKEARWNNTVGSLALTRNKTWVVMAFIAIVFLYLYVTMLHRSQEE